MNRRLAIALAALLALVPAVLVLVIGLGLESDSERLPEQSPAPSSYQAPRQVPTDVFGSPATTR